mmetsp:Transcript_1401/g.3208  ORF Transcript_1401/g.3208 Transcript_1401/m.3208 type:complete len:273 (-) Transcript_1401:837-1655(-)
MDCTEPQGRPVSDMLRGGEHRKRGSSVGDARVDCAGARVVCGSRQCYAVQAELSAAFSEAARSVTDEAASRASPSLSSRATSSAFRPVDLRPRCERDWRSSTTVFLPSATASASGVLGTLGSSVGTAAGASTSGESATSPSSGGCGGGTRPYRSAGGGPGGGGKLEATGGATKPYTSCGSAAPSGSILRTASGAKVCERGGATSHGGGGPGGSGGWTKLTGNGGAVVSSGSSDAQRSTVATDSTSAALPSSLGVYGTRLFPVAGEASASTFA